jgi:hypothetical protein
MAFPIFVHPEHEAGAARKPSRASQLSDFCVKTERPRWLIFA